MFSRCTAIGFYAEVVRQFPEIGCDENYSAWSKRLSVTERFLFWLKGEVK